MFPFWIDFTALSLTEITALVTAVVVTVQVFLSRPA
ncbi:hypothetical protein V22_17080 [Calycomorphotria hydatis]|uniref:Uncharacterized protein n=1 Tax=Calycomorphotria hydatis TaxID=2528027 RepID=A0A517T7X2_9PLAN|nr:hypothetical protein V22_17080 [Calycomorphotria hydatis]